MNFMILYLNTTEKNAEIKLYNDEVTLIDEVIFDGSFILSEELDQKIERLLQKNTISKDELSRIAVHCGPGSYTGLRIGVTTANFIAFGLNIPVVKITKNDDVEKVLRHHFTEQLFVSPAMPIYLNSPQITKKK